MNSKTPASDAVVEAGESRDPNVDTPIVSAGYADAYPVYRDLGWTGVLKLAAGTKMPPPKGFTGHDGDDPSEPDRCAWAEEEPGGNLALRMADGMIGIDVDAYGGKTGGETFAEAERRWGALPPTYRSTSRDDGVSGIRPYRVPPGTVLRTKIEFPELGLGGIEIVQRHHRYAMCWPSIHPEKRPYRWLNETTGEWADDPPAVDDLPDLPPGWVESLGVTAADLVGPGAQVYDVGLSLTDGLPSEKVAQRLTTALADARGQNRHDDTCKHALALLRHGKNGEPGTKVALTALQATFVEAVTADGTRTGTEAVKEFGRYITNGRAAQLLAVEPDPDPAKAFWQPGGERVVAAAVGSGPPPPGASQPGDGRPRLWSATDLKPAAQPRWLAKSRMPFAAVSLLVGDEGIGKSLLWVWVVAAVTTGKPLPGFGIPARDPAPVIVVVTEDGWQDTVQPRLQVAGADLDMVRVICTEDDGSGSPEFPRDLHLIEGADPKPALVVVDAWLDTVPSRLSVKDPQQARQALHPWKETATRTGAAVLLLCHTNRVSTANPRDRYGVTGELRKKARMTLYAQADEDGNLIVGPEKANGARTVAASRFTATSVDFWAPTDEHDGTVPLLTYLGESEQTAREFLADSVADGDGGGEAVGWLAAFLADGPRWSVEVHDARQAAKISVKTLRAAKLKLGVKSVRGAVDGPWFMALPQHSDRQPGGQAPVQAPEEPPVSPEGTSGRLGRSEGTSGEPNPRRPRASGKLLPDALSTREDVLRPNGETRGRLGTSGVGADSAPPCIYCGRPVSAGQSDKEGRPAHQGCQQRVWCAECKRTGEQGHNYPCLGRFTWKDR